MRRRSLTVAVALAIAVIGLSPASGAGQAPVADDATFVTPWGDPDLQGIWANDSATPFQRPETLGDRATLTDEELAAMHAYTVAYDEAGGDAVFGDTPFLRALASLEAPEPDSGADRPAARPSTRSYNQFWMIDRWFDNRTSLIVDPPDGRLPARTEDAAVLAAMRREARGFDSYENRPAQERCLVWSHEGPPMMPPPYNDLYQIFQTPGYVVLFPEMANNPVRIISTDNRAHVSDRIRQWPGHSVGRWDGDTLVVDTTNFTMKTGFQGSGDGLHVVERFTRVADDQIRYEFTVDDATTWTRPWTVEMPMMQSEGPLYEYTCHEGNYGMRNTMRGARLADRQAADGQR